MMGKVIQVISWEVMTRCVDLEGARVHALVFVPVLCFKRTVLSGRHRGAQALFTSQGNYITGV